MKMSRRKVRETIFLLLFRVEFNTQEELQEQIKWYFEERPDIEGKDQIYIETKIGSILKRLPEIDEHLFEPGKHYQLTGQFEVRNGRYSEWKVDGFVQD